MSVLENIAKKFVQARRSAESLTEYPGPVPRSIEEAYSIQDAAIDLWGEEVVGWKVGRINGPDIDAFGTDRLAGPIFAPRLYRQGSGPVETPVFAGGFAAVEGECAVIVAADADPAKTSYSMEETAALIGSVHSAVEIASSPFPEINDHGPLVTISDFGNNHGLVIGDELPDWLSLDFSKWPFETSIDGQSVGKADASGIPGGPVESFRFMLENAARRGRPLKKGMAISTGAVTGVHVARVDQLAAVKVVGTRDIEVRLVPEISLADAPR